MIDLDLHSIAGPSDLMRVLAERPELATPALARRLKDRVEILHLQDARAARSLARCVGIVAERCGDLESAALAHRAAGLAALAAGRYRDVVAEYEAAERLYSESGDEIERARALRSLIDPLVHVGRVEEAFSAGKEAREIFDRAGEPVLAAQTDVNVGNVLQRLDRHADALTAYARARRAFRMEGDRFALAVVDYNRANALADRDRLDAAELGYRSAMQWFAEEGQRLREAQCLYALAGLDFLRGRVTESLRGFARVRAINRELGDERHAALCALDEAELLLSVNAWEEARERATEAAVELEGLGMIQDAARAETFLGVAALHLGRRREAGRRLAAAAAAFIAGGNAVQQALVEVYSAELALRMGDPRTALARARSAARRFDEVGMETKAAYARVLMSEALAARGRPGAAERTAGGALAALSHAPSASIEWRARRLLARLADDPIEARRQRSAAMDAVERLRTRIVPDELLAAFQRDKVDLYADAALDALEDSPPDGAAAFEWVDRARARALAARLARPATLRTSGAGDRIAELRREMMALDRRVRALNAREAEGRAAPDALRRDLAEREARVARLHRAIELERDPGEPNAVDDVRGPLQDVLGPHEALVEYAVVDGRYRAAIVDRTGVRWTPPLAHASEVEESVSRWAFLAGKTARGAAHLNSHRARLSAAAIALLERLGEQIWSSVAERVGDASAVVVVPDGALGDVPFAALRHDGCWLVERCEVSTAPSARTLVAVRRAEERRRPFTQGALVVGVESPGLPGIGHEARAVALRLPGARTLIGRAATRREVLSLAPGAGLIHLAAHARYRPDSPLFSSIDLADGRLGFYDLFDLDLTADLVVLSGCETGRAAVLPGNERMGLARGFLAAGAGALVTSLWSVEDGSTSALFDAFYARLAAGDGPRPALAGAMRQRIEEGALPHEWAPFTLSGGSA